MNWINTIMLALGLTCLTGSVWTLIWCAAKMLLKRNGNITWIYRLLKFALAGYMIPALFLLLLVNYQMSDKVFGFLFQILMEAQTILNWMMIFWGIGMGICCLSYIPKLLMFRNVYKNHLPVTQEVNEMVKNLCRQWGVKKPVRVRQGYLVKVPFIFGVCRPCIFLPVESYSRIELEMILSHELIHFRQRDVIWKPLLVALCCINWFNPVIWLAVRQFQKWAEASCDWACCDNNYSAKEYFQMIFNMADVPSRLVGTFAPTWLGGENELSWRIRIMKENQGKRQKKWLTAVVTAGVILTSTAATFATEAGIRQVYTSYYTKHAPSVEESSIPVEELPSYTAEEQIGSVEDFEGMEVIQLDDQIQTRAATFEWTVLNKVVLQTARVNKSIGDTIVVSVTVEPSNKEIRVGILEPDGSLRYVTGSGTIVHTFKVQQNGDHRVYIYNNSGSTVNVIGYYR